MVRNAALFDYRLDFDDFGCDIWWSYQIYRGVFIYSLGVWLDCLVFHGASGS